MTTTHDDRMAVLDEMIRMGWEDVPGAKIPPDWATRYGPGGCLFRRLHRVRIDPRLMVCAALTPITVHGRKAPRRRVHAEVAA